MPTDQSLVEDVIAKLTPEELANPAYRAITWALYRLIANTGESFYLAKAIDMLIRTAQIHTYYVQALAKEDDPESIFRNSGDSSFGLLKKAVQEFMDTHGGSITRREAQDLMVSVAAAIWLFLDKFKPQEVKTKYGLYRQDFAGLWHYTLTNEQVSQHVAAEDALERKPKEAAWFWFKDSPAPISQKDTVHGLVGRWLVWREGFVQSGQFALTQFQVMKDQDA